MLRIVQESLPSRTTWPTNQHDAVCFPVTSKHFERAVMRQVLTAMLGDKCRDSGHVSFVSLRIANVVIDNPMECDISTTPH